MSLLNRSNVKKLALATALAERPAAGFTRIGKDFIVRVEANTRNFIEQEVKRHPSVGVTIK